VHFIILLLAGCRLAAAEAPPATDLSPWLAGVDRAESVLATIDGYSLIFHKQEMLANVMQPEESMELKFMKPFSVYLKWINAKGKGGEAIYVRGWNKDRVRVHPGGVWGMFNFNLEPLNKRIMKQNRHPITWVGLDTIVGMISDNVHRGMLAGEFTSIPHGDVEVFGHPATMLEGILPADQSRGYYCRRTIVCLDIASGLPVRICNYDWSDRLVEEYGFENFHSEAAMSPADFDPVNPGYRF
jgi:hypothetical protein